MRTSTLFQTGTLVTVGLLVASPIFAASFNDIGDSSNQTAIQSLSADGVIGGYSDGTFKPQATINRAELAKILVTASGATPTVADYHDCFSDVTTEWFAPYVCYAKEKEWVTGYSDGTFRPSNPVNTAEAIKMILNAQGITVSSSDTSNTYSDVDTSAWYAPYVETANGKGLLQVASGKLGVNGNMTRGLVAESIYRARSIKKTGANKFDDSAEKSSQSEQRSSMAAAYQQSLQQYIEQANAASDKTVLTKDEFTTELASLQKAEMAKFQQNASARSQRSDGNRPSWPSFGSGSMRGGFGPRMGSGSDHGFGGPSFGSGSMREPGGDRGMEPGSGSGSGHGFGGGQGEMNFSTATTFWKYTDTNSQEVLLALDANGSVVFKWPGAFGHGDHSSSSQS